MVSHEGPIKLTMRNIILLVLGFVFFWNAALGANQCEVCEHDWFGPSCQYKCHCTEKPCLFNGTCTNDGKCQKGWFGPACQYDDLAQKFNRSNIDNATLTKLTDNNDSTCINASEISSLMFEWNKTYPFTWLRLHVQNSELLQSFTVQFQTNNSANLDCNNSRSAIVTDTSLDIHCDMHVLVSGIILTGPGLSSLCSLYISGGRNVALKNTATQSSTYNHKRTGYNYSAIMAVDGYLEEGDGAKRCSHTNDSNPWWSVQLSQPRHINRYVLHNRKRFRMRLQGFTLSSKSQQETVVFTFTDRDNTLHTIYEIISAPNPLISVTNITVTSVKHGTNNILTLCEIEIFGDSACPEGKYGRECDQTCNCAHSKACFVSTGGCPFGCAAGYYGESCHLECQPCNKTCIQNCQGEGTCDVRTGRYAHACKSGLEKPTWEDSAGLIAGLVIAVTLDIILAAVVIYMRKKGNSRSRKDQRCFSEKQHQTICATEGLDGEYAIPNDLALESRVQDFQDTTGPYYITLI